MLEKIKDKVRGVIHIGANVGQEHRMYEENGWNAIYFEPIPACFEVLKSRVGDQAVNYALGNFNGTTIMHVSSNNGVSSSLLEPKLHLEQYPTITFNQQIPVQVRRLDDLEIKGDYNFISVDTEGYELEVFKGATETLKHIDFILAEVNRAELYKGCPMVQDIDEYLLSFGFTREDTDWMGKTWGDALYIK